jgi:hypothetical protein
MINNISVAIPYQGISYCEVYQFHERRLVFLSLLQKAAQQVPDSVSVKGLQFILDLHKNAQ